MQKSYISGQDIPIAYRPPQTYDGQAGNHKRYTGMTGGYAAFVRAEKPPFTSQMKSVRTGKSADWNSDEMIARPIGQRNGCPRESGNTLGKKQKKMKNFPAMIRPCFIIFYAIFNSSF